MLLIWQDGKSGFTAVVEKDHHHEWVKSKWKMGKQKQLDYFFKEFRDDGKEMEQYLDEYLESN